MATEAEAKKVVAEQRQAQVKNYAEGAPQGKPTPTQAENDLHAMGVPLETHEDDGSGPEAVMVLKREAKAERTGQPVQRAAAPKA